MYNNNYMNSFRDPFVYPEITVNMSESVYICMHLYNLSPVHQIQYNIG